MRLFVWVRVASSLSIHMREMTEKAGVSPGRISQIQGMVETEKPEALLAELLHRYKVKA